MKNQNILITGAAGFVGKHLVKRLIEEGYQVTVLVRWNMDTKYLRSLGAKITEGDLQNQESLSGACEGIDCLVHLATTMKGVWEEYLESTVFGTRRLLEASREKKVKRFIFVSSIAVYDVFQSTAITENSPIATNGLSNYERSKIEAEKIVLEFSRNGIPCTILRSGVIYGPGGTLFPPRLGFSFGENRYLVIGHGKNRIPLVYIRNLIEAVSMAIKNPTESGSIFNIVDDQTLTQEDYLKAVQTRINQSLRIVRVPYRLALLFSAIVGGLLGLVKRPNPFRKVYLYLCAREISYPNTKAKNELGWKPVEDPFSALNMTVNWFSDKLTNDRIVDPRTIGKIITLNKPMTVGLIGCGVIAKTHLDILKRIQNVHVIAVCDPNKEAAQKLAREYGIPGVYSDCDTMFKESQLDAVHVLTPPQSRREIGLKAAVNKCHILLEKPMAMNAQDARAILDAARKEGVKVCLGHNHVFDPPMIEARKLITKGALGHILYAESWYGFNLGANLNSRYMMPGAQRHWSMQLPGKLYQNLISHPISVLTDVIGYPEKIHATATSANVVKSMKSDELKVLMESNGKVGLLTLSLAVNPRYQFLNVYGTEMCVFVDFLNKTMIKHSTPKGIPKSISRALMSLNQGDILIGSTVRNFFKVLTNRFTYFDGTEILIKEFYKSLEDGSAMPVSGEDGLKSMEIMDEVWKQIDL